LRLSKGIDLTEYKNRFGVNLLEKYADDLSRLQEFELIEFTENRLRLTPKGMVYSNEVFSVFV
jgi:oxygen-independent coproporphyrinogen-3 oxidase